MLAFQSLAGRDADVTKSTIALGSQFDSSVARSIVADTDSFVAPVQQGTLLVAACDVTVCDGHVICRASCPQSIGTLETDTVIPGGVYAAV